VKAEPRRRRKALQTIDAKSSSADEDRDAAAEILRVMAAEPPGCGRALVVTLKASPGAADVR